jgi:hypothetical protein
MHSDPMFTIVPIFIGIVAVIVIGSIFVKAVQGVADWSYNNSQPVSNTEARVVTKRTEVSGTRESSSTRYFATFELDQGERREFCVSGSEYGMLSEGDLGQLQSQGTRYLGFTRSPRTQEKEPPAVPVPPQNLVCDYCGSALPTGSIKCAGCGWTWRPKVSSI